MHQFLHLISCFNFNNTVIYFIKNIINITNYIILIIFHNVRFFRSYTSNISLFSIETVRSEISKFLNSKFSLSDTVSLIYQARM